MRNENTEKHLSDAGHGGAVRWWFDLHPNQVDPNY
jgi:hypothetical protein